MSDNHRIIPEVSLVVPTVGREFISICLESVLNGSRLPARLVVVDQGANPELPGQLDAFRSAGVEIRHLKAPLRGAAAARNRGFALVESRFIAATDDDCVVDHDWIESLYHRLLGHPEAIITGRVNGIAIKESGSAPSLFGSETEELHVRPLLKRDPLSSGNMGFDRQLLDRIGPMDEHPSLRMAEDAEWSYRALRKGVPILYAPEVRVSHLEWRDESSMLATYGSYARSQGSLYGLHAHRGDWFAWARMGFDLLRGFWIVVRGAASRDRPLAGIGKAYIGQLLPGFIEGWNRPRSVFTRAIEEDRSI